MNQKESNSIYKSLKMIFWDIPVGIPKLEYGGLLSLLLIFPVFALTIYFVYLFQTEELNPCLEFDYETVCSGTGDAYECYEEYFCVKRQSDYTSTAKTRLWFKAQKTSFIFIGAYILVPLLTYILWTSSGSWFEKRYPIFHRFFERRWTEILISFLYLNTLLAFIVGYIWFF